MYCDYLKLKINTYGLTDPVVSWVDSIAYGCHGNMVIRDGWEKYRLALRLLVSAPVG